MTIDIPYIMQIPHGIKAVNHNMPYAHILTSTPPIRERPYLWSFSSSHNIPLRDTFITNMMKQTYKMPYYLRYPGYNHTEADLGAVDYHTLLQKSIFGICPEGNVPETWRFYEIMENGGIPVIFAETLHSWYKHFVPDALTEYIVAVEDPGGAIEMLSRDLAALEVQRERLIRVYNDWRDDWQSLVRLKLEVLVMEGRGAAVALKGTKNW